MSQQAVVTNYFVTRKRQRGARQLSKRQKIVEDNTSNETVCEDDLDDSKNETKRKTNVDQLVSSKEIVTDAIKKRSKRITRSTSKRNQNAKSHANLIKDFFSKSIEKLPGNIENSSTVMGNLSGKCSAPAENVVAATTATEIEVASSTTTEYAATSPTTTENEVGSPIVADNIVGKSRAAETIITPTRPVKNISTLATSESAKLQNVLSQIKQLKDKEKIAKLKLKTRLEKDEVANTQESASTKTMGKASDKRVYAYEKFHNLAQTADKHSGLVLPYKYKVLESIFHSVETIVSMLYNRQETATWSKIEKGVKDMIRGKIQKSNLSQIKHVYPDAYAYRQEKGIPTYHDNIKSTDYQLTLEPVINKESIKSGECPKLTGVMLVQRKQIFRQHLLDIVKHHHQEFLSKLDPSIKVVDEHLRRWHPQFPVDLVPDVSVSDLPLPPNQGQKCSSAKDVLEKSRTKLTKQAVQALSRIVQSCSNLTDQSSKSTSDVETNNNDLTQFSDSQAKLEEVKGISKTLLAKIRDKEANLKRKMMIRSDEDVARLKKLRLLPDLARSLRMLFTTETKASLPLEIIANKLTQSSTSISTQASMEEHLRLLSSQTEGWFTFTTVRGRVYGKLDKQDSIADVVQRLQSRINQSERS